jgi:hypothetical protein
MSKEILDKAKAHFREVMSGDLHSFYIDEWDTTFYYKKGSNFKQEAKIIELQNQGKTAEALIQMIVNRCLDAEGKRVFTEASKTELMNSVDPEVIVKIVGALSNIDEDTVDVETASKN